MSNLKELYDRVDDIYQDLYCYDYSTGYIELVKNLGRAITDIYKYFGLKRLTVDIDENFHKGDIVEMSQDEGGIWMANLEHTHFLDMYEYNGDVSKLFDEEGTIL